MARPTLYRHRKFMLLVDTLGMPEAHVLGHLEYMWLPAYESGDPAFSSFRAIEVAAHWKGEPGAFARAVTDAESNFVDAVPEGGFVIHDFWDHAPDYVRKRHAREQERKGSSRNGAKRNGVNRKNGSAVTRCVDRSVTAERRTVADFGCPPSPSHSPSPSLNIKADRLTRAGAESNTDRRASRSGGDARGDAVKNSPGGRGADWDRQRAEVDGFVARLLELEEPRNRGPGVAEMWRIRACQVLAVRGGANRLGAIVDEVISRRNPRVAETKGFSRQRIENESAWVNDQVSRFLKLESEKQ